MEGTLRKECWLVILCCLQQVFLAILVESQGANGKLAWREGTEYRHNSVVPVPTREDVKKLQSRNYIYDAPAEAQKTKKWNINRILYTLPIGATFPIFYSSRNGYKKPSSRKGKKDRIYFYPEQDNYMVRDRDTIPLRPLKMARVPQRSIGDPLAKGYHHSNINNGRMGGKSYETLNDRWQDNEFF